MEFIVTLAAAVIAISMVRIDLTLRQVNRNLEQITSALRDKP